MMNIFKCNTRKMGESKWTKINFQIFIEPPIIFEKTKKICLSNFRSKFMAKLMKNKTNCSLKALQVEFPKVITKHSAYLSQFQTQVIQNEQRYRIIPLKRDNYYD